MMGTGVIGFRLYQNGVSLTHFIRDTNLVVSDTFENDFINIGNIGKYFTESCSEGPNNQFFLICSSNHGLVSLNQPIIGWTNSTIIDLVWNGLARWCFNFVHCYFINSLKYIEDNIFGLQNSKISITVTNIPTGEGRIGGLQKLVQFGLIYVTLYNNWS